MDFCAQRHALSESFNRTRSLQNREAMHCCGVWHWMGFSSFFFFFRQEIAVLKGRSWALKATLLMIATLKSSPEGDLFGRNRSCSSSMFLSQFWKYPALLPDPVCRTLFISLTCHLFSLSGFCTASCLSTMMAQTTVYLSQQRKTNCKSNLTSPFTSTSGGGIRCFLSPHSPPNMLSSFIPVT